MRIKKYELFIESRKTRSEVELFMERFDKMVQSRSYRKALIVKEEIELIKQFSILVEQSMINEEYDIVGWLKDKFGQAKDWVMSLVDKIQDYKFVEKLGDKAKAVFDYLIEKGGELKRKAIVAICKILLAVNKGYIKMTTFFTLFMIGNVPGAFGMVTPKPEKVEEAVKTVEKVIPHVKDVPVEKVQEGIIKIGETTLKPEAHDQIQHTTEKVMEQGHAMDATTIAITVVVIAGLAIGGYLAYKYFSGGGNAGGEPVGSLKKFFDPKYKDGAETQQKDRVKDLTQNCNDTHGSRYQFLDKPSLVKSAGGSDEVILKVPSWFDSDSPVLYDGIDLTEVSQSPAGEVSMFLIVDHNFTDAEWKVLSKYFDLKNNPNALKLEGGKLVFQNPFDNPDFKADYANMGCNHHAVVKLHISIGTGGGQHTAPDVNVHGGTEDGLVKVLKVMPNQGVGGVRN